MKSARALALTLLSLSALSASVLAQAPAPAGGNNNRRAGGNFNPEDFRKQMADRLKTALKASDEEWTVLQPLIENVTKLRDASGGGRGFGGRGGGDRGGASTAETTRPGAQESQALRTTLENESASPEEIKAKLAAVRNQRKQSAAGLVQARAELQKVLTVRQEAVLVSYGILE